MDAIFCLDTLQQKIADFLMYRDGKIAVLAKGSGGIYETLAEISRHTELLAADLREAQTCCHNELQTLGYRPPELPMPDAPEMDVRIDEKSVCIVMGGMLPYPLKGGVHFLHEKLDTALLRYSRETTMPRPLFSERCAVVFIHHYEMTEKAVRNMRDYDNVERRCITNVIARHFLKDDSPTCYISMDILAPGESNYTEIRVMAIPAFRAFVMSKKIEYSAEGIVSKKVPKLYQKTQ